MRPNRILLALIFCGALISCASQREKVIYLQNARPFEREAISQAYELRIEKDDLLNILVSSLDPELSTPFNQVMATRSALRQGYGSNSGEGFLVDDRGEINYPILGRLKVAGMTRTELEQDLQRRIKNGGYIMDPTVSVELQNFKVAVIGEVQRPGTLNLKGERLSLLQAISMAGDLTIYGKRDRVFVVRESAGEREVLQVDLRDKNIFDNPAYYLQQNDVVYVEPNDKKTQISEINQNNNVNVWLSVSSTLVSVATLTITIIDRTNK